MARTRNTPGDAAAASLVRVRLVGAPESVALVLDQLAALGAEVTASRLYPSRYCTGDVRIYAEITPALVTGSEH